ncbi:DUF3883 domain-containing protein [Leptospira sp. SA-E8]|uniref:DUF3883 domain-containing protein n=1 Tax=Leptospira sp. SA-E8 TaxID=3422259 RepID=UPI003EB8D941
MNKAESENFFRMSVFEALLRLRRELQKNNPLPVDTLIELLKRTGSGQSLGWSDATIVVQNCPSILQFPILEVYMEIRIILDTLIRHYKPLWMRNIPRGRRHLTTNAPPSAMQCFTQAKLMTGHEDGVIEWWDSISLFIREIRGEKLLETGRMGELMSFQHELKRLNEDIRSPSLVPELVSLDDNTLGYDIRSFLSRDDISKLFIEVKASTQGYEFHLSRNEWNVCQKNKARYLLHHWILPQKKLNVYTPEVLEQHIPSDQGKGEWVSLKIVGYS